MESTQLLQLAGCVVVCYVACVLLSSERTRDYAHGICWRLEAHAAGLEASRTAASSVKKAALNLRLTKQHLTVARANATARTERPVAQ